jgi:hypothetical protein
VGDAMAEKKNLVIKVKLPTDTKSGDASLGNPKVITVWNVQRITVAGGVVLGFILLLVLLFSGADETENAQVVVDNTVEHPLKTIAANQPPVLPTKPLPEQPVVAKANPSKASTLLSGDTARVRRALLTTRVIGKEPGSQMPQTLGIKSGQPVTVYYFTELRGMNGKTLYHQWLQNGVQMANEALLVEAERWRVTTHRTMDNQSTGQWTVRLTDGQGMLLDEKYLTVNAAQ